MTDSPFTLRPPRKPEDYPALARVRSADDPEWPVTPELLRVWHGSLDPTLFHTEPVEDRGRGVAKALKVAAMRALADSGGGEIRTFNDKPNAAMLEMNRALGFVRGPTHFRYELHLDGEA